MSKLSLGVQKVAEELAHGSKTAQVVPIVRTNDQGRSDLQVVPSLAECEVVIERGQRTFREVGEALTAIRDNRLYLETHSTFEAYCRERWSMGRNYANKLIAATNLGTTVPIANERQARTLRVVKPEESIDPDLSRLWDRLVDVMDAIEALSSSDAPSLAAAVSDHRRASTAKKLRKLGTYLGRVAWLLEAEGTPE